MRPLSFRSLASCEWGRCTLQIHSSCCCDTQSIPDGAARENINRSRKRRMVRVLFHVTESSSVRESKRFVDLCIPQSIQISRSTRSKSPLGNDAATCVVGSLLMTNYAGDVFRRETLLLMEVSVVMNNQEAVTSEPSDQLCTGITRSKPRCVSTRRAVASRSRPRVWAELP